MKKEEMHKKISSLREERNLKLSLAFAKNGKTKIQVQDEIRLIYKRKIAKIRSAFEDPKKNSNSKHSLSYKRSYNTAQAWVRTTEFKKNMEKLAKEKNVFLYDIIDEALFSYSDFKEWLDASNNIIVKNWLTERAEGINNIYIYDIFRMYTEDQGFKIYHLLGKVITEFLT